MDDRILQSVVEMTGQGDTDSLEYSLVATLAEMIPSQSICICKLGTANVLESLESVIRLKVCSNDSDSRQYEWNNETQSIPFSPQVEACLKQAKSTTQTIKDQLVRLLIPIRCKKETIGIVMLESEAKPASYQVLIEGMVRIYENYLNILSESENDTLTGLLNRRTFDKKLSRLLQTQKKNRTNELASGRYQEKRQLKPDSSAWLAIMDIDHFKRVNDTYGHVYGDEVLLVFSQKMKRYFRKTDLLFRFGGEEFLVVLEPIPHENALNTLERFRKAIDDHNFPLVGKVTISIGFAKITEQDYPPTILEYADKALYYAKTHGRNSVHSYEDLVEKGELSVEEQSGSVDLF